MIRLSGPVPYRVRADVAGVFAVVAGVAGLGLDAAPSWSAAGISTGLTAIRQAGTQGDIAGDREGGEFAGAPHCRTWEILNCCLLVIASEAKQSRTSAESANSASPRPCGPRDDGMNGGSQIAARAPLLRGGA
jgi:hypothetical protein